LGSDEHLHAQGYFVYDSKKSGSMTVSHLRFGPRSIRAPYLVHNASFLQEVGVPEKVLSIDNRFFFHFISVQGVFAFLLTAFAGPGLISPDLANGALPLYFCRPFSRAEYVLGKSSVLAILLFVCFVVVGFYLGWFSLSRSKPDADGNKVDFSMSMDPAKMKSDLKKGGEKIEKKLEDGLNAKKVEKVLDEFIRPSLKMDGGDVEIMDIKGTLVYCALKGACAGCMGATQTMKMLIERTLKDQVDERIRVIEA